MPKKTSQTKTWHFRMKNTRDVMGFIKSVCWDAARINLPDGKTALHNQFIKESAEKCVDVSLNLQKHP